jgi:hypothetical protein
MYTLLDGGLAIGVPFFVVGQNTLAQAEHVVNAYVMK